MKKSLVTTLDGTTTEFDVTYVNHDIPIFIHIGIPVHIKMYEEKIVIEYLKNDNKESI